MDPEEIVRSAEERVSSAPDGWTETESEIESAQLSFTDLL